MPPHVWSDVLAAHKRELHAHITRTALDLIAERGLKDVSMSLLAKRAGIARATLYNHFGDFERVLAALVADQVAAVRAEVERRVAATGDPVEQLRQAVGAVLAWLDEQPRAGPGSAAWLSPRVLAARREPLDEVRELLAGILERGVNSGAFAAGIDPGLHARFITLLLSGLYGAGDRPATAGDGEQLVRFVLHGLRGSNATT